MTMAEAIYYSVCTICFTIAALAFMGFFSKDD